MAWRYKWFLFGLLFLWNPHINVIDVLPDVIGWFCIAIGLSEISYLSEEATVARKRAWILCGISFTQLLLMYVSIRGEASFPLAAEPTMVLTYTLVYGLLYIWLGISVLRKIISVFETYGTLHAVKAMTKRAFSLKCMTVTFFIVRFLCSILPECVYLRTTEYLDNVIYGVVYDIRNFRPYLVIFFTFIALIIGLVFFFMARSYLRGIYKDGTFSRILGELAEERHAEFYANQMNSKFATTQIVFLFSAVFFGTFTIDYIDYLPDFVGVLLSLIALYLLCRFINVKKSVFAFGVFALLATFAYWFGSTMYSTTTFATLPYSFFRLCRYCFDPSHPDVTNELRAALNTQWSLCLATAVKAILLIFFMRYVVRAIETLDTVSAKDGITVYDSMTKKLMRDERFAYERAPKDALIWFGINAVMEVIAATPPFAFSMAPLYLFRIGVFIVFLVKFSSYLSQKKTMLFYHFTYNTK